MNEVIPAKTLSYFIKTTFLYAVSITIVVSLLFTAACADRSERQATSRADEIASYISGTPLPESSPYYGLTQDREYLNYRDGVNRAWYSYRFRDLDAISEWSGRNIRFRDYVKVFYPFSGPDILNPLEFYPDAREYIMVGLESPGRIPDPLAMTHLQTIAELKSLQFSLHTLMKLNYFRTMEMQKELDEVGFNNIPCIMMFFIKRHGFRIENIRRIRIDDSGSIVDDQGNGKEKIQGTEITFSGGRSSRTARAVYLKADLSDAALKASPFIRFMDRQGRFVTFMKSAAYLPALKNFSGIRTFILSRTDFIIQDDSGIPLRYFPENDWKISYYGTYRVLPMFAKFRQPDLEKLIREKSVAPLKFSYGYGYTSEESHVMTAERK